MSPGIRGSISQLMFVGPNTKNPDVSPYPKDRNNFGPAVGFAYNATSNLVIRGGYQMQYIGGNNFSGVESALGQHCSFCALRGGHDSLLRDIVSTGRCCSARSTAAGDVASIATPAAR